MPKKNPYETLGVPKNASKEAIKRAGRKKMKKTHPDAGGEEAEFIEVQAAYKILTDDSRRARYDATGDDGEKVDNAEAEAIDVLTQIFGRILDALIAQDKDPEREDIVDLMRQALANGRQATQQEMLRIQKVKTKVERTLDRITVTEGTNFLREVVIQKLALKESELKNAEKELAKIVRALELLKKFKCKMATATNFGFFGSRTIAASEY
jgi:DnaJ-class molecular chaperone